MATDIHITAIVDKRAELGDNVVVGPYAIIDANVVISHGTWIGPHVHITGHTTIGSNNKIYHGASVGQDPQCKSYAGEPTKLSIGNNNTIREFCTIHTGTARGGYVTSIGSHNLLMAYTHVAHDSIIGNHIVCANAAGIGGHVQLCDYVIIGGYSAIHQFCVIGEYAMLAGAAIVTQDVPPGVLAVGDRARPNGMNIEGLRRNKFSAAQIELFKQIYKILYRDGLLYEEAKQKIIDMSLTNSNLEIFVNFFAKSQRGIIR